ncbi:MAG TPA: alpha/beta hydrolase [Candidatus Omnitrophota bacterium]|nr:alpha/beta hydrolase [Candidatus Omnitrophota bacterium]HQO57855.1 alpha/beta hydrolase [Candidatus Omnitrophota bacterium]
MSVPLIWLLVHVLLRRGWLQRLLTLPNIFQGLGAFAGVAAFFWYLSAALQGEMIWKEVFLAAYFLISVGIILYYARRILQTAALFLTARLKGQRIKRTAAGIVYGGLWLLLVFPYVLSAFSMHRPKVGDRMTPGNALSLPYEEVLLRTRDGVRLCAWFVPSPFSDKSVVVGHGLGANKSNFLPLVDFWHGLGYNVLIFDFRGHGQSEGHTVTFGAREKYDVGAAVDYLASRQGLDPGKIVGYGVSFGGAALIHAAAGDRRIQAVIVDSTFSDVETMAREVVSLTRFVPSFLRGALAKVGVMYVSFELGFDIRHFSPRRVIPGLQGQPVFIIHGEKDTLIPWEESKRLLKAALDPKSFYWVKSAGHYATLTDQDYRRHVQAFLSEHNL